MIKILYTIIILIILAIIIINVYNYFKTIEEFTTIIYVDYQPTTTINKYGITCLKAPRVYSWGDNQYGQLGLGHNTTKLSPTSIPNFNNIKAISAGYYHSLFLDNNGNVYSWGNNQSGQLGLGHNTTKLSPTLINYFDDNNIKIKAISAGCYHSLFLNNSGKVYSCGDNQYGEIGLGDYTNREIPTLIPDFNNIKAISAGQEHSLFLNNNGNVYSCGDNYWGQLGLGHNTTKNSPKLINYFNNNNINITAISACKSHSLFLNNNGNVYSCGHNHKGQLGLGHNTRKLSPTLIPNFNNIKAISTGLSHSLFLDNNGNVYSCGDNSSGQLGLGDNATRKSPTLINYFNNNNINITAISAGNYHCLFLDDSGNVYSCGNNDNGELGLGDDTTRNSPTLIRNFNKITAISTFKSHSLFL